MSVRLGDVEIRHSASGLDLEKLRSVVNSEMNSETRIKVRREREVGKHPSFFHLSTWKLLLPDSHQICAMISAAVYHV